MNEPIDTLRVYNSLKPGGPVKFDPMKPGEVSWYACGPTVYDKSHLGHARNYVSTDIIRRIMMHYYGMKVNFVMNITDIDDKVRGSLVPPNRNCTRRARLANCYSDHH